LRTIRFQAHPLLHNNNETDGESIASSGGHR
jgi:hypothetical protein